MSSISLSKAEKSYIQAGLLATPPSRADGRALHDFREVALEIGVAPLANGSAKLNIGGNAGSGTEVLAATKLEVESTDGLGDGMEGGRIVCTVSCSPAAYPNLSSGAIDDLQYDLTTVLHQTLSHPSLRPKNLEILRGKKSWLLHLDIVVLSDSGNIYDAIFMGARAALWDTKVPRTRTVEYRARGGGLATVGSGTALSSDMDVDKETSSGLDTRQLPAASDFELFDNGDEGEVLDGREFWPICVTLNLIPPIYFLDASLQEEAAVPLQLLLVYSFPPSAPSTLQAMRVLGPGELQSSQLKNYLQEGEKRARNISNALIDNLKEDTRKRQKQKAKLAQR